MGTEEPVPSGGGREAEGAPAGKVSITGLENPVWIRQVDDRKVELSIDYTMTVELANTDTAVPGEPAEPTSARPTAVVRQGR